MIYSQDKTQYESEVEKVRRDSFLCLSPNEMKTEIRQYRSKRSIAELVLTELHLVSESARIAGIRKALKERTQRDSDFLYDLVHLMK